MLRRPLHNLWLKLLSVAIALLLWLIVAGDRVVERVIRLPLEFEQVAPGLELVSDLPDGLDVRLRGPSGTLGGITDANASVVLDLRAARPGRRVFTVTERQVAVPYGVEVVQITPASVEIEFEQSGVRIVPIRPAVEGMPAQGYRVAGLGVVPPDVAILGPESALRATEAATTETVSIAGATRDVQVSVNIGVHERGVRLRDPQSATVTVRIARAKP